MNNVIIEPPTQLDVATMFEWGKQTTELWGSKDGGWYSLQFLQKIVAKHSDDIFLVARVNNNLAGMCLTRFLDEWAYCEALYVAKEYRRFGIARKLIDEVSDQLKKKGCTSLATFVEEENQLSLNFHKQLGYKEGYKFTFMAKELI